MRPSADSHRPLAPSSCARLPLFGSTQQPSAGPSQAARNNASRSRRETNVLPSPYSSQRSRTHAPNAATVTPISEQPLSAARFLYATARSVSGSSTTSYAIEVSMPDILAHPLSASGPIHGTYPKFRRSSRPQLVAAPPHLYPEQNRRTLNAAFTRRSAADTRVQRNHRLRKRKRNLPPSPSHQLNPRRPPQRKEGRPPFRTTGLPKPIYRTIESLSTPPISRSKALAGGNAAPR